MADASWLLQKAIFSALDGGLTVPVFDSPPISPAFPYVTIGEDISVDDSSKIESTQVFTVTIHVWSRQRGRHETKVIMDQIDDLLHDESLAIEAQGSPPSPPYAVCYMRRDGSQTFVDPDGLTMHGTIAFRVRIGAI